MSQTFTPSTWTGKTQQTMPNLNVRPNAPFYLLHSPFSWELINMTNHGFMWLPQFSFLHEIAGVNGIEETPQGPDSTVARMKLMDKGTQIIDRDFGYIARYATKYGGYHYKLKWDIPKEIGNRVYWNTDTDAYNAWRLDLVTTGVIAPPEIEVVQAKVSMVERKIERRLKFQHIPEIKTELDELYQLKKDMHNAYDLMHDPKPKRKKGAKNA